MVMDRINKKIGYIVVFLGVFVILGLVLVDQAGNSLVEQSESTANVIQVNQNKISLQVFQNRVQAELSRQPSNSSAELLRTRRKVFDRIVQSFTLQEISKKYALAVSGVEMWDHLRTNPLPGLENDTSLQTNGVFDQQKYEAWLVQDEVLNSSYMAQVEKQLKSEILPQVQMFVYVNSFVKPTTLEANFNNYGSQIQSEYHIYKVRNDSIPLDSSLIAEDKLKQYYRENKGQFVFFEDGVLLDYAEVSLSPSSNDSVVAQESIADVYAKLQEGNNFEELVEYYSEDEETVLNGGSLGASRGRGFYSDEFDQVVFNLKKGEYSKPFLSSYGWQIVRCDSIQGKGSDKKIKASHILVKVRVGTETVDAKKEMLDSLKLLVEQDGKNLRDLYENQSSLFDTLGQIDFTRWNGYLTGQETVSGAHSFAFGDTKIGAISSAYTNEDQSKLFVLQKLSEFTKEGSFERARKKVKEEVIAKYKKELAKQHLLEILPEIKKQKITKLAKNIGKAKLQKTSSITAKSWDFTIGYDQVAAYGILADGVGQWGQPIVVDNGAIVVYPITRNVQIKFSDYIKSNTTVAPFQHATRGVLASRYLKHVEKSLSVENNLDVFLSN